MSEQLEIARADAPLIVCFPHTGLDIPSALAQRFVSPWLARKDADHHVHRLYNFARQLGATTIRTTLSRSVIDVNRDPSGASLYPGQATTDLCPLTTFDGEPLYRANAQPTAAEIDERLNHYFWPYHNALQTSFKVCLRASAGSAWVIATAWASRSTRWLQTVSSKHRS